MAKYSVQMKTQRVEAGQYKVTYLGNEVDVSSIDINGRNYWIASSSVNTSDPVSTKREAVKSAEYMLVHWNTLKKV